MPGLKSVESRAENEDFTSAKDRRAGGAGLFDGAPALLGIDGGALPGVPPQQLVGLGGGADTAMVESKRGMVQAAVDGPHLTHGCSWDQPLRSLQAIFGPEFCILAGAVLGAAGRSRVVILGGLATSVAALIAVRLEPAASAYLVAGQHSRERLHAAVLQEFGLEPLLELGLRAGEGVGAALASSPLLAGVRMRRGMARNCRVTAAPRRPLNTPKAGN